VSTTSKKPFIDPDSEEFKNSLKNTDDLYRDISEDRRRIKEDLERQKSFIVKKVFDEGENFLGDIEKKNHAKEIEKNNMVNEIVALHKNKYGKANQLYAMSHEEIKSIYVKAKESKKSFIRRLFEFFMG
jgi:hypothetical protein